MNAQKSPENLSVEELRRLLIEKQRSDRQLRMEYFSRTGRVVQVESAPAAPPAPVETHPPEPEPSEAPEAPATRSSRRGQNKDRQPAEKRPWLEKTLYYIEIGAILGLVGILAFVFIRINTLNNEVASSLQQPTLTPTPLIMAVVLPSGHTSPNSPGGVQPNDAEIPEHLRPLVQSLANIPIPTPSPEQAVRLQVPNLGIDAPIVQGDGWEQLKKGVGQHVGTPNPGQKGNIVLSAHDDVFGEIFKDLDRLKEGDKIILFTNQRTYTYSVRQTQVVEPTQVDVMNQTQESIVTLISCYPYLVNNQRIVVTAKLE
jgi:sortase A